MNEKGESKCVYKLSEKLTGIEEIPDNFFTESGRKISLATNIFPVCCETDSTPKLYQYHVNITPDPCDQKTSISLICSTLFPGGDPNSEWSSLVYLDQPKNIISSRDDLAKNSHLLKQNEEYDITISLEANKEINLQQNSSDLSQVSITTINRCFTTLGFSSLDENFINNTDYKDVDHLRLVNGFHPKLCFMSKGLNLVLDTATRIDRKGTLYDILLTGVANPNRRQGIEDSMNKMTYVTRHLNHQKTARISRIRWNSKAQTEQYNSKFTVAEYFASQYNFVAKPDDPIVEIIYNNNIINCDNVDDTSLIPASALSQIGITDVERSDQRLMSSVRDTLFLGPNDRKNKLESIMLSIKNDDKTVPLMKNFGLSIGDSLILDGYVLDPPELVVRNRTPSRQLTRLKPNSQMTYDVSNICVAVPSRLNSAPLILAPDQIAPQIRDIFLPRFLKISSEVDLAFNFPEIRFMSSTNHSTPKNEILDYIKKNGTPSFIIIFSTEKNQQRYDSLKQLLITSLGIPSQFILADSIFGRRSGVDEILTNIAFQITAKTGGIPYYVPVPVQRTIIIGIAGYTNYNNNSKETAYCLSASLDQTCARFYSDTLVLKEGQYLKEEEISVFVKKSKDKFKEIIRESPTRIIVYRLVNDEEELIKIHSIEVPLFKTAADQTSLVFFAVQKASTVRLFYSNDEKFENPPPGTIAFNSISSGNLAEFYIVSNHTQFGTAMPVRYTILTHSPAKTWTDEQLAKLTFYLSFNYCNFAGAMRLPSPLTNALKIATFSQQHLNYKPPSSTMVQKIVNFV